MLSRFMQLLSCCVESCLASLSTMPSPGSCMPEPALRRSALDCPCTDGPVIPRSSPRSSRRVRLGSCGPSSSPEPGGTRSSRSRSAPIRCRPATSFSLQVRYAALNGADLAQRAGRYPAPPGSPQDVPGIEVAGTVIARGQTARGFEIGDRVFGIVGGGGLADRVVVHERHVVAVPAALDDAGAAAVPGGLHHRPRRDLHARRPPARRAARRHRRERRRRHRRGPDRRVAGARVLATVRVRRGATRRRRARCGGDRPERPRGRAPRSSAARTSSSSSSAPRTSSPTSPRSR